MKINQSHFYTLFIGSLLGMLGGCVKIPEYPKSPTITFNSVYFKQEGQSGAIYLVINYRDGDGDLGLNADDILVPPFQETIDSVVNPNHYNIFPVLFRKVEDRYDSVLPTGYRGIFPRLRDSQEKGPIEGTIQFRMESLNFFNRDSTQAKVKVYIQDRALNKSNRVESPPFEVKYKE